MKKVLIIARAFPPFLPVGHSIRAVKFAKFLPDLGWLPVILTVDDKREYETLPKVGSETLLSEIPPQVKIYRTNSGEPSADFLERERKFGQKNRLTALIVKVLGGARRWTYRNILPDRYLTWLPFAARRGQQIVRTEKIDVIFATIPPYSAALVGACLKVLTGKPLVLDFRDDWIDTPWFHSRPKVVRKIKRWQERWAVEKADKVILVTEWSKNAFQERYPEQPGDKFILIPNGCDLEEFEPLRSVKVAPDNSKFTIFHAGTLTVSKNWGRDPRGLFQAVSNLRRLDPELGEKITLIFAGDLPDEYKRLAEEMGISKVILGMGHIPHNEVLRLSQSSNLLLAMNYDGWSTLIPGKIYEYWAVGGPQILLLSCPGAAASFIEQHHLGFVADPSDVNGIQQAILHVYNQSKAGTPLRISTAGIEQYDRRALTSSLSRILSDVDTQE